MSSVEFPPAAGRRSLEMARPWARRTVSANWFRSLQVERTRQREIQAHKAERFLAGHTSDVRTFYPSHLLRNLDGRLRVVRRVRTDPDFHAGGLDHIFVVIIPKRESIRPDSEADALRFPCGQLDMLKALERANRLRRARAFETNVELNCFLARALPRIGDLGADGQRGVRRAFLIQQTVVQCSGAQRCRTDLGSSKSEGRIRESVAEWKLRTVLLVDIPRNILVRALPRRPSKISLARWAARIELVIIKRLLPDGARPGHNQFSGWIGIAEERSNERGAGLHSRKPRGKNRGNVFERPGESEWPTAEEDQDDRFSRGNNRFEELFLAAWQAEMRARSSLTSHIWGVFTKRKNHGIGVLRGFDSLS